MAFFAKLQFWEKNSKNGQIIFKKSIKKKIIEIYMDKKFFCEKCNYKTNIKSHWEKHLKTKKHSNMFKCEICNLQLSSKSSYYRHKKLCNGTELIKKMDMLYEKIVELETRLKSCEDKILIYFYP